MIRPRGLGRLELILVTGVVAGLIGAVPSARGDDPPLRVVVHFNGEDPSVHERGLKNIANILKDSSEPVEVVAVVHGPAIGLVVAGQSRQAERLAELQSKGVRFVACENTMRERTIAKDQLLSEVGTVPSGALEVVRRQRAGFAYLKP